MIPPTTTSAKGTPEKAELAEAQLDRVLEFFSRAESKMSFLFALDSALLAVLVLNLEARDLQNGYLIIPAICSVVLLAMSLYHLYRSWSPNLLGGKGSLIYFREVARKKEDEYADKFKNQSDDDYLSDVLSQIWRNSTILAEKFSQVDVAFRLTALAFVPWLIFLVGAAIVHEKFPVIR